MEKKPEARSQKQEGSGNAGDPIPAAGVRAPSAFRLLASGFWLLSLLPGCMPQTVNYSAPSATAIDSATRGMMYWFDKPAVDSVRDASFDVLWNAANRAANDHSFTIDLAFYREGLLTTRPLTSKMPFEFWKHDVIDPHAQLECTLSTMRRTVRLKITKLGNGQFVCEPKVVVERYAMPERRITSVVEYQEAFSVQRPAINGASDEGEALPTEYWYAVGRDEALEHALANAMRRTLTQTPHPAPHSSNAVNTLSMTSTSSLGDAATNSISRSR